MSGKSSDNRLDRRDVTARLLADRGDLLVVAGLGGTAWDITAAGDSDCNFPLWGGMGNAAMVGLGLALAQPQRPVLVITGDGEMLMGLGALATIAVQNPDNLAIAVLDNERYGETGQQPTHTADGADLAAIARGCGIDDTRHITSMDDIDTLAGQIHRRAGLIFAQVKITTEASPLVLPPRDGPHLKTRFRKAVLGDAAES